MHTLRPNLQARVDVTVSYSCNRSADKSIRLYRNAPLIQTWKNVTAPSGSQTRSNEPDISGDAIRVEIIGEGRTFTAEAPNSP